MIRICGAVLCLVLVACGRMPGGDEEELAATDSQTADAVLTGILERLGTEHEEHGPEFVRRVPVVKQEVVVAHGFADWRDFSARLRLLGPSRDLAITQQITDRIEELLQTPREPAVPAEETAIVEEPAGEDEE